MLNINNLRQLAILILLIVLTNCQNQSNNDLYATRQAEESLTDGYGAEVHQLIESFLLSWSSIDVYRDPDKLSEYVTGLYLDHHLNNRQDLQEEPYWLIRESAVVENLRVVDYQSKRFKAVACATLMTNKITVDGTLLDSFPPRKQCGVFVFVREEEDWKLAGYFDTTIYEYVMRDWTYAPDWLKEIIGELPDDPSMIRERK